MLGLIEGHIEAFHRKENQAILRAPSAIKSTKSIVCSFTRTESEEEAYRHFDAQARMAFGLIHLCKRRISSAY